MPRASATKETETEASAEGEPASAPETSDDSFAERVKDAVRDALGSLLDSGEVEVEDETEPAAKPEKAKRRTYRDEEDDMDNLVTAKVKELLDAEKKAGEKHPEPTEEKAKPEPVPAMPAGRRVEKFMGWS